MQPGSQLFGSAPPPSFEFDQPADQDTVRACKLLWDTFRDPQEFIPNALQIQTRQGTMAPFVLKKAQRRLIERVKAKRAAGHPVRFIIDKTRRVGLSSVIAGLIFQETPFFEGQSALILAHEKKAARNLFGYYDRFEHSYTKFKGIGLPRVIGRSASQDSGSIRWINRSQIEIATAKSLDFSRSFDFRSLHLSEYAYYPSIRGLMTALIATVADDPATMVFKESTAKGYNEFYSDCIDAMEGRGDYEFFFVGCFEDEDNWRSLERDNVDPSKFQDSLNDEELGLAARYNLALEQLYWRRKKLEDFKGDLKRFDQEYPHCVTGDTRVGTDQGIIRIKEAQGASMCGSGDIVQFIPQGEAEVFQVQTRLGYRFRGTSEHKVLTGPEEWTMIRDLHPGQRIFLAEPMTSAIYYEEIWHPLPSMTSSIVLDERWGRFLGYFVGDGSLNGGQLSFCVDRRDEDVAEDIRSLLRQLVGVESSTRHVGSKSGGLEIRTNSTMCGEILERLGVAYRADYGQRIRRVCIPDCIWRSPRSVIRAFLSALFECDGWNSYAHSCVNLFGKGDQFIADVQHLLLVFSITGRRATTKKVSENREYPGNELRLRTNEAIRFNERIGFISERKRARAKANAAKPIGAPRLKLNLEDEIAFVRADGIEPVYDISVADSHRFDAGGIVVHNSWEVSFQASGRQRFDPVLFTGMPTEQPCEQGELRKEEINRKEQYVFRPHQFGELTIWKRFKRGGDYIGGVDVAKGVDINDGVGSPDPDWCVAEIGERSLGEQVMELHTRLEAFPFAQYLYDLGHWCFQESGNWIFWVIEVEFSGGNGLAVCRELLRLGYPQDRIYFSEVLDEANQKRKKQVGFVIRPNTRPLAISNHERYLIQRGLILHSKRAIAEHKTFVKKATGKIEHEDGCHDDYVFGCMYLSWGFENAPVLKPIEMPGKMQIRKYGSVQKQLPGRDQDEDLWWRRQRK